MALTVSVSDSSTLTDVPTVDYSIVVTDTVTVQFPSPLSVSDSTTVTDTPTVGSPGFAVTVADGSTVSDVPTVDYSIVVTDSVTVQIVGGSATLYVSVIDYVYCAEVGSASDSTTVTDTPTVVFPGGAGLTVSVSDGTTVTDSQIVALSPDITWVAGLVNVSDSTTLTDTPTVSIQAPTSVAGYVNVSDSSTVTATAVTVFINLPSLNVNVSDGSTVTDASTVHLWSVAATDNSTVTDTLTVLFSAPTTGVRVTDNSNVTDAPTVQIWSIPLADGSTVTDTVAVYVEVLNPPLAYNGAAQLTGNPFTYYSYDLLTGTFIGTVPFRGASFGPQLNASDQFNATLDLMDPRLPATNWIAGTTPNRTIIVADYQGAIVGYGVSMTRVPTRSSTTTSTTNTLAFGGAGIWGWFGQRVQATDYSAPPTSGIVSPMSLWTQTPWDASLIACQVIGDAIDYTDSGAVAYANILGGMGLLLNGAAPSASTPAAPAADWVAVTYPFTTCQTIGTIITQLSQLGLGIGFDFGVDLAYSAGPGSPLTGTVNISFPRRGRTVAQDLLFCDLTTARSYSFPEDGTQTANQAYEIGGSGAIVVDANVSPLDQGYPLWERVFSRANAQSQNIISMLTQTGLGDLSTFSYAPVAPTITLGVNDPNLPLGSYIVGDDIQVFMPVLGADGNVFDARFPAGMNQEWRITGYLVNVTDEGDATVNLTLAQPPLALGNVIAPAV